MAVVHVTDRQKVSEMQVSNNKHYRYFFASKYAICLVSGLQFGEK